ncbi:LOW QUALITY PROTEIN: hypothetical protein U9M48_026054 [Paspalum notatum var. saurae]|uniref:Aminotransferase-like plant mobile domain-containing protein n=1 Tax=Paspalum notatum var. saurae TaxID=547442 RepID=A0AAQ3TRU0_PASNO
MAQAAAPYVRPELFDEAVDRKHRSYLSAVLGESLGTIRARTSRQLMLIHELWIPKLHAAGLLPLARLVEGDKMRAEVRQADRMTRFQYDFPLICALVDQWRPKTHTFHFPVGEMTVTFEDVAMLLGLPPDDGGYGHRRHVFLARFANVPRNDRAPTTYQPFDSSHGPTLTWLQQFSADYMTDDAQPETVNRFLEATLLWLFGYVMFWRRGIKVIDPYARMIADAPLEAVPQINWGSAILPATYRGLCTAVSKGAAKQGILLGRPLLLQL